MDAYPLSSMQQGMLFHSVTAPASDVYVEQLSCCLRGALQVSAFGQAWEEMLQRHAVLRTAFAWRGLPEPLQVVGQQVRVPLEILDWRDRSHEEQERLLAELRTAERQKSFKLTRAPLLRIKLISLSEDLHQFVWTWHHIILDAWSVRIVLEELLAVYEAHVGGRRIQLEPSRPYKDFIALQRSQDLTEAEVFWRNQLAGFEEPTPLLFDGPAAGLSADASTAIGDDANSDYALDFVEVTSDEIAVLKEAARKSRITLNTLVQGAWSLLLSRYSGRDDVVFGTAIAGRPPDLRGVETMVGLFINTLPVRVKISAHRKLGPWLDELQQMQAEARRYEQTPLMQIQGWSSVSRGAQLMNSLLVVENLPLFMHRLEGGGLKLTDVEFVERANFPLTVTMVIREESQLGVAYDRARFDRDAMLRLLHHLKTLLAAMTEDRERRLGDLEFLGDKERQQLMGEWSRAPVLDDIFEKELPIHRVFEALAKKSPKAPAVTFTGPDHEVTLTYQDLNQRANRLARRLKELGVNTEDRVAICMDGSVTRVIAILAVLKAGGAYLPLEPESPRSLLFAMLNDCDARLLLTQPDIAESFRDCPTARIVPLSEEGEFADTGKTSVSKSKRNSSNLPDNAGPGNLAYVIYTSGSTGKPKGVAVAHRSVQHLAEAQARTIQMLSSSRVLQFSSLSFDASVFEIFNTLLSGGHLFVAPRKMLVPSYDFVKQLERWGITSAVFPPSIISCFPTVELPALETLIAAGESCSAELVAKWGSGRRFVNAYGPTEITVCATATEVTTHERKPPIGHPIGLVRIYILDNRLRPTPAGLAGDLYVGGPGVARGYWNQPRATAKSFLPDPFSGVPGGRMYRTGDLARFLPNGEIDFLGRLDEQVKVRGFRIELAAVEMALKEDAAIRDAVVVVAGDSAEENRLIAYVVPEGNSGDEPNTSSLSGNGMKPSPAPAFQLSAFDESALKTRLRQRLPEHMLPSSFVLLGNLPLMPSGKVNRKALPAVRNLPAVQTTSGSSSPRSNAEAAIAKIWQEILQRSDVNLQTNFFDHGGHSLLLLRVQDRISEALNLEVAVTDLFKYPTVETLARRLSQPHEEGVLESEDRASSRQRASARQKGVSMKAQLKAAAKAYGKQMKAQLKEQARAAFEEFNPNDKKDSQE